MPIEIKELVIRTHVGPVDDNGPAPDPELGGERRASDARGAGLDTEQLIQECVRQVLRILAQQRER